MQIKKLEIKVRLSFLFKILLLVTTLIQMNLAQDMCNLSMNSKDCSYNPDCIWQVNESLSSCQDISSISCDSLTPLQCTGKCSLVGEEGNCVQVQNFQCSQFKEFINCNFNKKCVFDSDSNICIDKDQKCGQFQTERSCLQSANVEICYWNAIKSGDCINTASCSSQSLLQCTKFSDCKLVKVGQCLSNVKENRVYLSSIHIQSALILLTIIQIIVIA